MTKSNFILKNRKTVNFKLNTSASEFKPPIRSTTIDSSLNKKNFPPRAIPPEELWRKLRAKGQIKNLDYPIPETEIFWEYGRNMMSYINYYNVHIYPKNCAWLSQIQ